MIPVAELIGYVASFFVAISLVMSSLLALRVLNLIGAVAFVIYGTAVGAIPIVITNGFITLVDIYYLIRMIRPHDPQVVYIPVGIERRAQLLEFVRRFGEDIGKFFPDFSEEMIDDVFDAGGRAYLALDDLEIAGFALVRPVPAHDADSSLSGWLSLLLARAGDAIYPDQSALVIVDYVKSRYRGLGLVQRLYAAIERDAKGALAFLVAPVALSASRHRRFLTEQGYAPHAASDRHELMVKTLGG